MDQLIFNKAVRSLFFSKVVLEHLYINMSEKKMFESNILEKKRLKEKKKEHQSILDSSIKINSNGQ